MSTDVTTSFAQRKKERVSSHSHITGLGLDASGKCIHKAAGLVSQAAAREAAGFVVELVRNRKMAGRAVLFAGPSGTGKTALAIGISKELGAKIPFTSIVGSEVYSSEIKKTEVLMEGMRKSIGIVVREVKEVYEGEVTEVTPIEVENPHGGYGKTISHVDLGLRTTKGQKRIKMDSSIYRYLESESVAVGDVIYIEATSGVVKKMGRCDAYAAEHDLEAEEYVPLPKGDIYKKKEIVQRVSLHDIDAANASPQSVSSGASSALSGLLKPRKTEITDKLRLEVNKMVNTMIDEGAAEIVPGVLFIDEVHMLDIECFTFLNKVLESSFTPIVVLATNRGVCTIRGTDTSGPHGMPTEILDRLLIIRTEQYSRENIAHIVQTRCQTEAVELEAAALEKLSAVGSQTSLRFALHLLSPASIFSAAHGRTTITTQDVDEVLQLFKANTAVVHGAVVV
ncbi:RuvBlike 1-like protein [Perkinsela sp. CCAP 1560/4]|nr:RuvBlike 1-like protein [Perkinsela sp. CCAP 1560/4]|eukprot:KNH09238.1 RuvBlike 1-like protein [Perkinsela sp. CCAP 1560/4]